jgi:hypothetical protein
MTVPVTNQEKQRAIRWLVNCSTERRDGGSLLPDAYRAKFGSAGATLRDVLGAILDDLAVLEQADLDLQSGADPDGGVTDQPESGGR